MYNCPIVVIYHPDLKGPCEIDESAFDPKKHELYDAKKHGKAGGKKVEDEKTGDDDNGAKLGEAVGPFTVGKNGLKGGASKFVVFNMLGERFDDNEYKTEAEAWSAATALMVAESGKAE